MIEKYKAFTGLFFGALWVLFCFGFVAEELIPPLEPLRSFVFLLCDIVFLGLGLFTLRSKRDIIVVVTFLVLTVVSSRLNHLSVVYVVNGARDFFGLLFAIPIICYLLKSKHRDKFIESFDKQLFVFLVMQAFCLVWQFIRYGANDHGGGSMGNGYSGIVSTLIYIVSFYLVSKRWNFNNYWLNVSNNKVYFLLLLPTFLNETKISFIFLMAYFLLLMRVEWKTVFKVFVSIPLIIVGMVGAGFAYLTITHQTFEDVFTHSAMDDYMVGEDPEELIDLAVAIQDEIYDEEDIGLIDIPRFSKLLLVPEALPDSEGGVLLGAGVGQFKGGSVLQLTEYAERWNWLLSGSIPFVFFILIQLGLVGVAWMFFVLFTALLPRSSTLLGKNIKIFLWLIILLLMFYNDSLRFFPLCFVLFYIALRGYVNVPREEISE